MSLSASLERFLADMEYPATGDDLAREAAREGLDPRDRLLLAQLGSHSYSARWQILTALRRADASAEASRGAPALVAV
ncbi:DUF2795 domain-containing protein [Microbacterium sp. USHLN186]|uniref:DUF2795 domain-containing protein n=1 Tax=Microbacterium sp. USHLN186 TaxID=3081286 RepID=UPI003017ABD8